MFGDTVERLAIVDPLTGEQLARPHRGASSSRPPTTSRATSGWSGPSKGIEAELQERLAWFEKEGKLLEAQRLRMRTQYDLEMIQEVGYCNGIENYSMHIDGRTYGEPPFTLLDYFPKDFLLVIDESHQAVPQLHGQYEGDRSRKDMLVEHGFRLPSARDNRPLRFEEVHGAGQPGACSCRPRPADYEMRVSSQVVEQIVRPTGLVDPEVIVKPTKGQIDDLMEQINQRVTKGDRVLVTTLTKKMAEDLTDYLLELGRAGPLPPQQGRHDPAHRDPARPAPRRVRRAGRHQPPAGGPRPPRGVARRHPRRRQGGLPAQRDVAHPDHRPGRPQRRRPGDHVRRRRHRLDAQAISETNRRRGLQEAYNREHGIDPQTIRKAVTDILSLLRPDGSDGHRCPGGTGASNGSGTRSASPNFAELPQNELGRLIQTLEEEMHEAAAELRFEYAARLRDEVNELKRERREAAS